MIGDGHISRLKDCDADHGKDGDACEMKNALTYLNGLSANYRAMTQPLTALKGSEKAKKFLAVIMTLAPGRERGDFGNIVRMGTVSGRGESSSGEATASELYSFLIRDILNRSHAGSLCVTLGKDHNVLDIFIQQFGELLCNDGYSISLRSGASSISYIQISGPGGKGSWTLVYVETMTGVPFETLIGYAHNAGFCADIHTPSLGQRLYTAIDAYQNLILGSFGAALRPTAGMAAMACVRHCLPDIEIQGETVAFRKFYPDPLHVAMERDGRGYRGGMTYATRYQGPSSRIDVIRQYTSALGEKLPYRSAFGRYRGSDDNGVFLCHVQFNNTIDYQIGVWRGAGQGFVIESVRDGSYVCVMHTAEFGGLRAHGITVQPWYGFRYEITFTLAGYVERLQSLLDLHGYQSHLSKVIKPLGNYVYGKFGQNPSRKELMFSKLCPGAGWITYFDEQMVYWPMVWERDTSAVTSTQHVDIAGTITAYARGQTLSMWAACEVTWGKVVRVHTDSLTIASETLPAFIAEHLLSEKIGDWRDEHVTGESCYVHANMYADAEGAHIAGVSDPTWEMVLTAYAGATFEVTQNEKTPLRGFHRGAHEVRKRFG